LIFLSQGLPPAIAYHTKKEGILPSLFLLLVEFALFNC